MPFKSPNYTQTPNDLFDELLPDMSLAELKVVLYVIRQTFGFHREEQAISIRNLARGTGLSVNSVMDGARQAEEHGLIERTQDGNKTTLWRAAVSVVPTATPRRAYRDARVSPTATLVGVKESINKGFNKRDLFEGIMENEKVISAMQNALIEFERALGVNSWPWDSTHSWKRFSKWVVSLYEKDTQAIFDYVKWRTAEGKYQAMSNVAIRKAPETFMDTGFPTFLAHTAMYKKSEKPSGRSIQPTLERE
jgi:hypothetical protein